MKDMLRRSIGLLLAAISYPAQATPAEPATYVVSTQESTLTYHVVHKLHKVDGVSKQVQGKARLTPTGQAQVVVRVAADSFDSANVNRDAHLKEVIESARFPVVELKALCDGVQPPASYPVEVTSHCRAKVNFHGMEQPIELAVKLVFETPTKARATATFVLSLDAFKVERPSLMFVKISDELRIDAALVLTQ